MRETDFIGQNKEKWEEFEKVLQNGKKDAENFSRVFVETTDDLSFSRTYYPNRSVRVYLNGIAQQIYQRIYKNRKREKGGFKQFWYETLPDAVWYARKELLLSFLIFVVGVAIGILSSSYDPEFVEIILGDQYVSMTEANIENGDPMAVYKQESQLDTFLFIAWNNVRVGLLCFVLGLLFEVGTVFIILSNAVMVGAFIWYFVQRDLFQESFFAIMLHGTLELSMIVLAGAAGLVLGRGLLFPGNYTRLQAFLLSARHGVQIMVGVSAFLLVAAFIEGFATRYTETPDVIRGLVILLSLAIVIGYFVWYPWKRHREGKTKLLVEEETIDENRSPISLNEIKTGGEIVNETWRLTLKYASASVAPALICAIIFTTGFYWMIGDDLLSFFDPFLFSSFTMFDAMADGFWFWDEANNFFLYKDFENLWMYPVHAVMLGVLLWIPIWQFGKKVVLPKGRAPFNRNLSLTNAIVCSFILLIPFLLNGFEISAVVALLCIFWWPYWLFILATSCAENLFLLNGIKRANQLLKGVFGKLLGTFLMQGVILWMIMSIVSAPLFYLTFQIIGINFAASLPWVDDLIYLMHSFMMIFSLSVLTPIMITTMLLLHFSHFEIHSASQLKEKIASIRFKQRAYGLEKER